MNKNPKIQPIILSGGSGSRLWPLSRESFPKQYIKLNTRSEYSFLQKTQLRLKGLNDLNEPIIICNEQQRFIVAEQMRQINIVPKSIILEPIGRNTAPAILVSSLLSFQENEDSLLLILSSDHEIQNPMNFRNIIELGKIDAEKGKLITFGVIPNKPETGYGYIEKEEIAKNSSFNSAPIKKFVEKPDLKTAKEFIKKRNFLWNSGIFMFKASTIINEFKEHQPEIFNFCQKSIVNSYVDLDFLRLEKNSFSKCVEISIDMAIMEKTKNANVIALDAGWNDIGNWGAIWDIEEKDKDGNVLIGDIYKTNVKNSYLNSKEKLLVGIGLENLIIVQSDDATLVAKKDDVQEIKKVVERLNLEGRKEAKTHRKVFRPWGYYRLIDTGINWQAKEIFINPKSSISLQKHNLRSEHWVILKGEALVQINEDKKILKKNQSTFIPINTKHRLSNQENIPLILIEIQCGEYLGEDDIVRYSGNYGRIN